MAPSLKCRNGNRGKQLTPPIKIRTCSRCGINSSQFATASRSNRSRKPRKCLPDLNPFPIEKMKKGLLLFLPLVLCAISDAAASGDVTAAQVNGTWKMKDGEFKIWALGQQRLQIEFSGTYEYKSPQGPTANEGQGRGIARIEGNTAIFKPEGAEDECKIALTFMRGKLVVTQTGTCGSCNHVSAEGTYTKASSNN